MALLFAAGALPALADGSLTFQSMWAEANSAGDCQQTDDGTYLELVCGSGTIHWYFTKPGHPAHPAVIKRVISYKPNGAWSTSEHGNFFAGSSAEAFKAWFAQIEGLDHQMKAGPRPQPGAAAADPG
jgi:hypothetical protein